MRAIFPYNGWKICLFILSIQHFPHALGSTEGTDWLLGEAGIMPKCPGNARFELQIGSVTHWQEDFVYLNCLLMEDQYYP